MCCLFHMHACLCGRVHEWMHASEGVDTCVCLYPYACIHALCLMSYSDMRRQSELTEELRKEMGDIRSTLEGKVTYISRVIS